MRDPALLARRFDGLVRDQDQRSPADPLEFLLELRGVEFCPGV